MCDTGLPAGSATLLDWDVIAIFFALSDDPFAHYVGLHPISGFGSPYEQFYDGQLAETLSKHLSLEGIAAVVEMVDAVLKP